MTTTPNQIPNGTTVTLPDGSTAKAYYDPRSGTYTTRQTLRRGKETYTRTDEGWIREFLTV